MYIYGSYKKVIKIIILFKYDFEWVKSYILGYYNQYVWNNIIYIITQLLNSDISTPYTSIIGALSHELWWV